MDTFPPLPLPAGKTSLCAVVSDQGTIRVLTEVQLRTGTTIYQHYFYVKGRQGEGHLDLKTSVEKIVSSEVGQCAAQNGLYSLANLINSSTYNGPPYQTLTPELKPIAP